MLGAFRLRVVLAVAAVCLFRESLTAADTSLPESIAGTWVLQQAASPDELHRELRRSLAKALQTPKLRGFCLRFPWKAADEDFLLIEAGLRIARDHGVAYSIRFMAGRHTPDRVFAFSGYGPLTDAAGSLADHVVGKIGERNPIFFCQANGWGPNGDWGAPNPQVETSFDRVWQKPICRGQQAIQPSDYAWPELFRKLYENRATYCEVYAPSFTLKRSTELAAEIRKFDEHIRTSGPLLPARPPRRIVGRVIAPLP